MNMRTRERKKQQSKKTYASPRLVTYGDLQRLTMSTKGNVRTDGDVGPKSRAGTPA